jgi:drug/metabolite transporter (DMT)-like permease
MAKSRETGATEDTALRIEAPPPGARHLPEGRVVPVSALLLALGAAFLHAFWNLVLARAWDPEAAAAVALVVAEAVFAPVAAAGWRLDAGVWPYLLASGVFELAYFALLAAAYARAELSVVYPLARGTAPVLVLVVAVVALGAPRSWAQAVGTCLVALGILLVRGLGRPARAAGVGFGLAIAACIAAYTLVDNSGIEHGNPISYLELSMLLPTVAYTAAVVRWRGSGALRSEARLPIVLAGLATFGAYALVLAALERAPAAPVAAVRETSIVIATALAGVVLGERVTRSRLAGATVVVAGVAVISVA